MKDALPYKPASIPPFEIRQVTVPKGRQLMKYNPVAGRIYYITTKKPVSFWELRSDDGTRWMNTSDMEINGLALPVMRARGKVLTSGLGLGLFVRELFPKCEVNSVTIIEREKKIIDLVMPQIDDGTPRTFDLHVVNEDLFDFARLSKKKFDFIYLDIWPDWIGPIKEADAAVAAVTPLLNPGSEVRVWLQELLDRVRGKLPTKPVLPGLIGIHEPCILCSKVLRNDYAGMCMDCADMIGVSELFRHEKGGSHIANKD